jgi:serum/glucocorticoid-regulated kinase 2
LKRMSTEKDEQLRNPFIVKLWWSFHDEYNLYLVLDFHPGGDLATQLSRWGRLGRDRARFYTAEIVEGVEGLHAAGVIYRDLKPENVLLGQDGHIVLVDFGLAADFFPHHKSPGSILPHWMATGADQAAEDGRPMMHRHATDVLRAKERDLARSFVGTAEYLVSHNVCARNARIVLWC